MSVFLFGDMLLNHASRAVCFGVFQQGWELSFGTHMQVVVAIDDSRSMAENACGSFALEAVTLICRAMARLEVGEMGVVSYGGSNSILPLHPLEKPFTDADGPGIMAQMKFSQVPSPALFCPSVLLARIVRAMGGMNSKVDTCLQIDIQS